MARPKNTTPTYKHHKSTGLARCWVNGRWVTLGKYGSPESKVEFARIVAELDASPAAAMIVKPTADVTIDQMLVAYWRHVELHYRTPDGKPTSEVDELRRSLAPVQELYGHTPAKDFGPRALATVRDVMVKKNWCRSLVNHRVNRIRRAFRWAAAEELIPVITHQALKTLPGLQRGRTEARESEPVGPVADEAVGATLPYLNRHARGLIEFQQLTGCRPGEACSLRMCDVDASGPVWLYRPAHHKTAHHGKRRTIAIGPRCQALLAGFITEDPAAYLFSPRLAVAEMRARRQANRKMKLYPHLVKRFEAKRKAEPRRVPAEKYGTRPYAKAIAVAVRKANTAQCRDPRFGPALPPLEHWHPNQLRHAFATAVRRSRYGLEGAQVALGHSHAAITEVYAERDEQLAASIALAMG